MKDLIFITAFCPTQEQELALEKCLESVLKCNLDVALISHTHIPIHIQKKCNFYVYDYKNEISDDYKLLGHQSFSFDKSVIQSRFFNKTFYGFAIYRMFSIVSQLAINFNYQNIHHIEYDCELLDKNLIYEHSKYLEEYDSVIYTNTGDEHGFLLGSFKSFKVSTLPDKFKNYDKNFIETEMLVTEPTHLEYLTKKLFKNNGNVLFMKEPSEMRFKKGKQFQTKNSHSTLYYNPYDETINYFHNSMKDFSEEITIIVNKVKVVNLKTELNHWYTIPLGLLEGVNHVRIDNGKKITYEKEFSSDFKEVFKIKSYITNEENN